MGNKESKPSVIPYEEALKKVSEDELKRLREAFKRYSIPAGYMSKLIFVKDVMGDAMPQKLGEHLFFSFGGTNKGITFKDLFCGLVLLTRGRQAEKLRFIFGMCANQENGTYVTRMDLNNFIAACDGNAPAADTVQLFRESDRVSYEQFCSWLMKNSDVMKLSAWLLQDSAKQGLRLSDESDTPTFYQTLAGVTHLEEADIIELEKKYWVLQAQSKSGRLDLDTFTPLIAPPMPAELVEGVFNAFDENQDNHIDLKEMACGLSACCRGPLPERQKFYFKIFDADRDGRLSKTELERMCTALLNVRRESRDFKAVENLNPVDIAGDIMSKHAGDSEQGITAEEFQVWAVKNSLPDDFNKLLFQICHIILGLRPQSTVEEKEVIMGWVERERRRGLRPAQTWYLISAHWWKGWSDYVNYRPTSSSGQQTSRHAGVQTSLSALSPNHTTSSPSFTRRTQVNGGQAWGDNYRQSHSSPSSPSSNQNATTGSRPGTSHSLPRHASLGGSTSSVKPLQHASSFNSSSPSRKRPGHAVAVPTNSIPCKPGPIDNTSLVAADNKKQVSTLTNEGGRLRRHPPISQNKDYEIIPDPVWKALALWYAGGPALPRNVIVQPTTQGNTSCKLELYPLCVKLLRHQTPQVKQNGWSGVNLGLGNISLSSSGLGINISGNSGTPQAPKRYQAYVACFSKMHTLQQVHDFLSARLRVRTEEMRLWNLKDENNPVVLEEDSSTLDQLGIADEQSLLIEIRNKDLSWPEEMSLLAKKKADRQSSVRTDKGVTGLSNLGNTCFMNSAVQCISNTQPLRLYFQTKSYLYELNPTNPLGMKGHLAKRYGDLCNDLWSGTARSIAPLKLRWTIAKYAPRFSGFQQHDSQELLAFLLDGLHEDLNRVHEKPYVELKDSDGRPDEEVATEAWENHLIRNKSVIVDLFQGQLKSQVRCKTCGHISVRFDPFTFLSLPLPMESSMHVEIVVVRLDGSVPVKYGLRLNTDDKYKSLKKQLADLCDMGSDQLVLAEIGGAMVRSFPSEAQKIRTMLGGILYAYEVPQTSPSSGICKSASQGSIGSQTNASQTAMMNSESNQQQPLPPIDTVTKENTGVHRLPANGDIPRADRVSPIPSTDSPGGGEKRRRLENGTTAKDDMDNDTPTSSPPESMVSSGHSPSTPSQSRVLQAQHSRTPSTASGTSAVTISPVMPGAEFDGFVVAMHRKMIRMDMYFLAWQKSRPCLFGLPLILPCQPSTTREDLYKVVWTQISRLVSPTKPTDHNTGHNKNHAEDCDSPRQKYPFTLKAVLKDGLTCAWCPWYRFCRGCDIPCESEALKTGLAYIAIEWDPTALHLRYQNSQERFVTEHESCENSRRLQTEPINLDDCLRAFTKEEELGEDELYYCSKCKQHRLAAKKLDIWRLPPILIVHLKRFQSVNGRWVKSQKIVKFPKRNFNVSNFVVPKGDTEPRIIDVTNDAPAETEDLKDSSVLGPQAGININAIEMSSEGAGQGRVDSGRGSSVVVNGDTDHSDMEDPAQSEDPAPSEDGAVEKSKDRRERPAALRLDTSGGALPLMNGDCKSDIVNGHGEGEEEGGDGEEGGAKDQDSGYGTLESGQGDGSHSQSGSNSPSKPKLKKQASLLTPPVDATGSHPLLHPQTKPEEDVDDGQMYDLYGVVSHTGILGGGHYVSYSVNPNKKWYCYNDSSVKEVKEEIDMDNAYMLFYECRSMSYVQYIPDTSGKHPDMTTIEDEIEADYRKFCVIQ
ncbi:ubiquitin carboxyl-terminal hydrolase 32 isoform X3 [Strongylocentrotus purpuratus]|uniref:Ubiquitin carboxyl-terminal hydrolase 32 n=1 Tax=Strongylocentrotus purpuratus TaxID=7668 RepID=A0A7M7PAD6_STRPU|nr:ubiquitin carboxyl-terminal hydrolase 32 isoform X3 [Strongylocentrotus purpuratus]